MKKRISKKYFKRTVITALIFAVLIFAAGRYSRKAQASPDSSVYASPAAVSTTVGESFNLNIKINPGVNRVSAIELHVAYDPAKLKASNVTPGVAFSDILQAAVVDNNTGTILIILGTGTSGYVTEDSIVATVAFSAMESGTANIVLTGTSAAASGEGGTNVVSNLIGSQITVEALQVKYGNIDFSNLATDWGKTGSSEADVNGDGKVDTRDLGIMMSHWGG